MTGSSTHTHGCSGPCDDQAFRADLGEPHPAYASERSGDPADEEMKSIRYPADWTRVPDGCGVQRGVHHDMMEFESRWERRLMIVHRATWCCPCLDGCFCRRLDPAMLSSAIAQSSVAPP